MTAPEIRLATPADAEALARLSSEAFGYPTAEPPYRDPAAGGRTTHVATIDGRIVAVTAVLELASWFWGAQVPTAGIASVKVALEHRRTGLLAPLFDRSLAEALERGMVLSTLYATAPGIYRRLGYETFTSFDEETVIPTAALAAVEARGGRAHRAGLDDIPGVRRIYESWAAAHNGPLSGRRPSLPASDDRLAEVYPCITIATDEDGSPSGYAIWRRTEGYAADGVLEVQELIALTEQGMRTLLSTLGTCATVAPTTVLASSQPDLAQIVLPGDVWRVRKPCPYGIAVLDVARAFTMRPYPDWVDLDLSFAVSGLPGAGQDGPYRLRVRDGVAEVDRSDYAATTFSARGLGLRYAGTHSCADLRRAGLLTGDARDDSRWDAVFSGRQTHVRDYF